MRTHIEAIRTLLGPLDCPVLYADATGVTRWPYVLIWSTPGSDDIESPVADDGAWSDLLGVTSVDTTANNTLLLAGRVRALLDGAVLPVDGRHAVLTLRRGLGQTVQPDRDLTIPDTNTHPCFAVDRYQLTTQPLT